MVSMKFVEMNGAIVVSVSGRKEVIISLNVQALEKLLEE